MVLFQANDVNYLFFMVSTGFTVCYSLAYKSDYFVQWLCLLK